MQPPALAARSSLAFLTFALSRTIRAFSRTPWEIDRLFGLGVAGLGFCFYAYPTEILFYGFGFLRNIIHVVCWFTMVIGIMQVIVGIAEWHKARQVAAFLCFFVYACISRNNVSPSGKWIYGVCALAEALIFIKRY